MLKLGKKLVSSNDDGATSNVSTGITIINNGIEIVSLASLRLVVCPENRTVSSYVACTYQHVAHA